jgi:hypothetical protein
MREIELTRGQKALVDDADYKELNKYKWYAAWRPRQRLFYACRHDENGRQRRCIYMHRQIMKARPGQRVDHVHSSDTLNNRRENLRFCTQSQNMYNTRKLSISATSRYKGVYWHHGCRKWCAQITIEHKRHHLGLFLVEEDAARAYDVAAQRVATRFALTNF